MRWPGLSQFDLRNPNDIGNAHEMLLHMGLVNGDLMRFTVATAMALRLASTNPHGYLVRILRDGFTHFGPADRDFAEAKAIVREIEAQ